MRQKLFRRLAELEKISAAAAVQRASNHLSADSAIEELRAMLCANGFPQESNESLAETLARFMRISLRELKQQLEDLSCGHPRSVHAGGLS